MGNYHDFQTFPTPMGAKDERAHAPREKTRETSIFGAQPGAILQVPAACLRKVFGLRVCLRDPTLGAGLLRADAKAQFPLGIIARRSGHMVAMIQGLPEMKRPPPDLGRKGRAAGEGT